MDNQSTIIALPIASSPHSKRLEWAIRDFITSNGNCYYCEESDAGIISSYFRVEDNICIEQKIHIRQEDYVCYTTLSCYINPENTKQIIHYTQIINTINTELDYGNFEIDVKSGKIRFRTYYEPDGKVYMEALDKLLGYPMHIIMKYAHVFRPKNKEN